MIPTPSGRASSSMRRTTAFRKLIPDPEEQAAIAESL
jgi:hypothetical protein